jgi:RES domain-containing protein
VTAWRIVKAKRATTAFDGEGARILGGRWNSPGLSVIYTAESAALAALEMLVHLGRGATLPAYVLIPCSFGQALVSRLDRSRLPPNWRSYPAPPDLQLIGNEWLKRGTSAILDVPNAIIAAESTYLLNPRHADFGSIRISKPQPFEFDLRLLRA